MIRLNHDALYLFCFPVYPVFFPDIQNRFNAFQYFFLPICLSILNTPGHLVPAEHIGDGAV